jgi:hypothetical protein
MDIYKLGEKVVAVRLLPAEFSHASNIARTVGSGISARARAQEGAREKATALNAANAAIHSWMESHKAGPLTLYGEQVPLVADAFIAGARTYDRVSSLPPTFTNPKVHEVSDADLRGMQLADSPASYIEDGQFRQR